MKCSEKTKARLDALPNKVRVPLRELLSVGHVSEEVINTVLDATELAGSSRKLSRQVIGCHHDARGSALRRSNDGGPVEKVSVGSPGFDEV